MRWSKSEGHDIQTKAGAFGGRQTHQGKSQNPVAGAARRRETDDLKPADKAVLGMASELPGRNESERTGGPESFSLGGRALKDGAKAAWGAADWLTRRPAPTGC